MAATLLLGLMGVVSGQAWAQPCTYQTVNQDGYEASSANCTSTGSSSAIITVNLAGPQYNQLTYTNQGSISTNTPGFSSVNLFAFGIPLNAGDYAYTTSNYLTAPPIFAYNQGSITLGSGSGSSVAALLAISTGAGGIADGNTTDGGTAPNNHYMGRNGGPVTVENSGAITVNSSGNAFNLTLGGIATPQNEGINAESIGGAGVADKHGQGPGGEAGSVLVTTDQGSSVTTTGANTAAVFAMSAGGQGSGYSQDATHNYDSGGNAGDVVVTHSGTITGTGAGDVGIFAFSAGGSSGATDNQYSLRGGDAGNVTVNLQSPSSITMSGDSSIGVFAVSAGGLSWYADNGVSSGHQNGNGSAVTVTLDAGASITTSGELGAAIVAASTGGNANTSEAPPDSAENGGSSNSIPTTRAPAGNAGSVTVTSGGAIATAGDVAIGIAAVSSTGGTAIRLLTNGPDTIDQVGGGSGSPSGVTVTLNSGGSVATSGAGAIGILGLSVGGPGGVLDTRGGLLNLLGASTADPGVSGNEVNITSNGSIATQGTVGIGILAQSIGGGGGTATGTGGIFAIGSSGGVGGNGGTVTVSNSGALSTRGDGAIGILAQSIGGGGGNGGNATGIAASVGGSGGAGGSGGQVNLSLSGNLTTSGDFAPGGIAQSVGGGGGNGGYAKSYSPIPISAAIGGSGSAGGTGGPVSVNNLATIVTQGEQSAGILAQSVGGGGGNGGAANTYVVNVGFAASVAVGGSSGAGGAGGTVTLSNGYHISTAGLDSIGILAQSIGGGGGNGGSAQAKSLALGGDPEVPTISFDASVGGNSGAGGGGNAVTITNTGEIFTSGAGSHGILAQSVGGGGGNGGDSSAAADAIEGHSLTFKESVSLGGNGGAAGDGGTVIVNSYLCSGCESWIATAGNSATGIVAQSIGGGGGNGGAGDASVASPNLGGTTGSSLSLSYGVGGSSAGAGSGGAVTVSNGPGALITTTGSGSQGILAQSIGGGGGNGGGGAASGSGDTLNVNVAVGGSSGAGGNGGSVTVTNGGTISTGQAMILSNGIPFATGGDAVGILAQSIGGGGGTGGSADPAATISNAGQVLDVLNAPSDSYSAQLGVGGKGALGGTGGAVSVTNSGAITTLGERAYGILAQSIGGGGGSGGTSNASANSVLLNPGQKIDEDGKVSPVGNTYDASITVGGSGGTAGSGGPVMVDNTGGSIITAGYGAHAILAQSVGGGGGVGADGTVNDTATIGLGVGYSGGGAAAGAGGGVTVTGGSLGTVGDDAYGILAQSIGGGGGAAGAGCSNSASVSLQGISATPCFGNTNTGIGGSVAPWNDASSLTLAVGGNAGASGNGGTVDVTANDAIVTTGARSFGIAAQSIGGGGGLAAASAINIGGTPLQANPGQNAAAGGNVTVSLAASGSITTSGAGAWGILAQSIGGGGGFVGDASLPLQFPVSNTLHDHPNGSYPDSGSVTVNVAGNITTTGANAHGIFAQAIGGGGGIAAGGGGSTGAVLVAGNSAQIYGNGTPVYAGEGFGVTINQTAGTIRTSGPGSIAIIAQGSGKTDYTQPIDVTIGGTVIGGTNAGYSGGVGAAGMLLSGGVLPGSTAPTSANLITVNGGGSVSTMDGTGGTAITTNYGITNVVNSGTITGSIDLGSTPGTITNNASGVLDPGATLVASTLTNSGTLDLPDFQVNLTGSLLQTTSGTLTFGFTPNPTPMLVVSGSASLQGTITPVVGTYLLPATDTLLTSPDPTVNAAVTHPLLFDWNLQSAGNAITITPTSNFLPAGVALSGSESSLASYLTRAWNGADPRFSQIFATLYNGLPSGSSGSSYSSVLDQLSPRATQVPVAALDDMAGTVLGSAMSCPQFEDGTTLVGEGRCVWAKAGGQVTNEDGYGGSVTSSTYRIGGQGSFAPNWRLGAAFGAGAIWADEGNGSKGSGQTYDASVALKYSAGPWLFAGSLALANASYEHSRVIGLPDISAVLQSNSNALLFGGRLRAAYDVPFERWYLRPMGDLDLYYTHTPAFNESGSTAYALAIGASSKVNLAITPALEIGSRIDLNTRTTLRTYADVGMSVIPDNQRTVAASFAGALTEDGAFQTTIKSPNVTGNLDLGVQLYHASGFDMRAEYNLRGGDSFLSQGGTLRLGYRF